MSSIAEEIALYIFIVSLTKLGLGDVLGVVILTSVIAGCLLTSGTFLLSRGSGTAQILDFSLTNSLESRFPPLAADFQLSALRLALIRQGLAFSSPFLLYRE